ncbi:sugar ABC transporter ATP-binding protein [Opitutus sp. GAS368]|uniref:sugar ABC transporter ATP-binding protein n=1 Tax=Opitutus sp. GAS368 TaxID=1882749 RepID=UPI00087B8483|nr:sugar ABC transporter ATP-binding protein [Opitutus sp. GAS368]SDR94236.1 monosaccharide ABC transporter ATP-binding protein, CUT2 family [Opitutus sp. GAS368]
MTSRLRLSGVRKRFGATIALDGVSFDLAPGEVHALVGENGAGKSTLMKILSGVHAPDAGTMALEGAAFAPRAPLDARRAGVAMVNQELAIAPHLTVAENLVLGAEPTRRGWLRHAEERRLATDALTQLGRPDIPLHVPAGSLSVAEQQLVEIGRAIVLGCRVLVLDEPTSSLTRTDAEQLFALVRRLRGQGQSIIYISHFLEEVQALSDRYTVLRDGRSVATGRTADTTMGALAQLMVGRTVDELYTRTARVPGGTVLEVNDLAGPVKPSSASLTLRRGEVLGLAGLVGAGRSELLRTIFALDAVRAGSVRVGAYAGPASPRLRWQQGLGLLSEDRKTEGLALNLSLEHNLTLPKLGWRIHPGALAAETAGWIDKLGVRCAGPGQPIGRLSGGNQQKIALGRLLRNGADVLLLDEPTRGVDIGAKQNIYRLIDELACSGKAVLMVSSYLPELLGTCDRIAVMCRGVLGPARPVAEWNEHRIMLAATGAAA